MNDFAAEGQKLQAICRNQELDNKMDLLAGCTQVRLHELSTVDTAASHGEPRDVVDRGKSVLVRGKVIVPRVEHRDFEGHWRDFGIVLLQCAVRRDDEPAVGTRRFLDLPSEGPHRVIADASTTLTHCLALSAQPETPPPR